MFFIDNETNKNDSWQQIIKDLNNINLKPIIENIANKLITAISYYRK